MQNKKKILNCSFTYNMFITVGCRDVSMSLQCHLLLFLVFTVLHIASFPNIFMWHRYKSALLNVSGQKWGGRTPRSQRKSWQKSECLTLLSISFFLSVDKWSLYISVDFRVPKASKDKQETEDKWESEEIQWVLCKHAIYCHHNDR